MGSSKDKQKGWHSRRHQTREAQDLARENFQQRKADRPKQFWDEDNRVWIKEPV